MIRFRTIRLMAVCLLVSRTFCTAARGENAAEVDAEACVALIERACDAELTTIRTVIDEDLVSATISPDGQRVGALTLSGFEESDMQGETTRSIELDVTRPAEVRFVDTDRVMIWEPSRFRVANLDTGEIVMTVEPKPEDKRFVGWGPSSDGTRALIVAANGNQYILGLNDSQGSIEMPLDAISIDRSSQAISNDGKRVMTALRQGEVSLSNQDLEPPNHIGTFRDKDFVPGRTKTALGNRFLCLANVDTFNILSIPGVSTPASSLLLSGDFVCLFLQSGDLLGNERFYGAFRSTFSSKIHVVAFDADGAKRFASWSIPEPDPHRIVWSDTGEIMCSVSESGFRIYRTPAYNMGYLEPELQKLASRLFEAGDFDKLEEIDSKLTIQTTELPGSFERWRSVLSSRALAEIEEIGAKHDWLDRWLTAYPHSRMARLIASTWYATKGWEIRGTGVVQEISRDRLDQFETCLLDAQSVLGYVDSDDCAPVTLDLALEISKGLGTKDWERERLIEIACNRFPWHISNHKKILEMSLPRWGGSVELVKDHIDRVVELQEPSDADGRYASLVLSLLPYFDSQVFFDLFEVDLDRLVNGAAGLNISGSILLGAYRNLIVHLSQAKRWKDLHRVVRNYNDCTPFMDQSYRLKGTAAILRSQLTNLPDIGKSDTKLHLLQAERSLMRRIQPSNN
ncbi:MAG: DUF4034 domain-containing protein [Planctomycetota bacterium]